MLTLHFCAWSWTSSKQFVARDRSADPVWRSCCDHVHSCVSRRHFWRFFYSCWFAMVDTEHWASVCRPPWPEAIMKTPFWLSRLPLHNVSVACGSPLSHATCSPVLLWVWPVLSVGCLRLWLLLQGKFCHEIVLREEEEHRSSSKEGGRWSDSAGSDVDCGITMVRRHRGCLICRSLCSANHEVFLEIPRTDLSLYVVHRPSPRLGAKHFDKKRPIGSINQFLLGRNNAIIAIQPADPFCILLSTSHT